VINVLNQTSMLEELLLQQCTDEASYHGNP